MDASNYVKAISTNVPEGIPGDRYIFNGIRQLNGIQRNTNRTTPQIIKDIIFNQDIPPALNINPNLLAVLEPVVTKHDLLGKGGTIAAFLITNSNCIGVFKSQPLKYPAGDILDKKISVRLYMSFFALIGLHRYRIGQSAAIVVTRSQKRHIFIYPSPNIQSVPRLKCPHGEIKGGKCITGFLPTVAVCPVFLVNIIIRCQSYRRQNQQAQRQYDCACE